VSTNQLRRQDEENKNLREELERAENREREHVTKLREENHRYTDLESKVCLMMSTQMLHNMQYSFLYIYFYIFSHTFFPLLLISMKMSFKFSDHLFRMDKLVLSNI
jgi:hypothetical protein